MSCRLIRSTALIVARPPLAAHHAESYRVISLGCTEYVISIRAEARERGPGNRTRPLILHGVASALERAQ